MNDPSPFIQRFAELCPAGGSVLDLACGAGRHARFLLARGCVVTAVDRDLSKVRDLEAVVELIDADLEADGATWPVTGRHFDAVIVTNYLWRPLLPAIAASVANGGVLLYETFAVGNERYGKPSNPDFLLRKGELLEVARQGDLEVIAFEHGLRREPSPAMIQRIAAWRDDGSERAL